VLPPYEASALKPAAFSCARKRLGFHDVRRVVDIAQREDADYGRRPEHVEDDRLFFFLSFESPVVIRLAFIATPM